MNLVNKLTTVGIAAVAVTVVLAASSAQAFSLRSPQVAFNSAALQAYLTANDGGITVTTDQVDAQKFSSSVGGNSTITLMVADPGATIGVYNALDATPALDTVFPNTAGSGWFANLHFSASTLQVYLYDASAVYQGLTTYPGFTPANFGFYLQNPSGSVRYSQDYRNSALPQVLTYAGTGANIGDWWECFEPAVYSSSTSTFNGAIVLLQSMVPTPTRDRSWGSLKATYR